MKLRSNKLGNVFYEKKKKKEDLIDSFQIGFSSSEDRISEDVKEDLPIYSCETGDGIAKGAIGEGIKENFPKKDPKRKRDPGKKPVTMDELMDTFFSTFHPIPWLVPAAAPNLTDNGKEDESHSFDELCDLNVAALVPGRGTNAPFDIDAYTWPSQDPDRTPVWRFEVTSARKYSIQEGIEDLVKKLNDERTKGLSHAMFIGVREQLETEIYAWIRRDLRGIRYLRVVILMACKKK